MCAGECFPAVIHRHAAGWHDLYQPGLCSRQHGIFATDYRGCGIDHLVRRRVPCPAMLRGVPINQGAQATAEANMIAFHIGALAYLQDRH